MTTTKLRYPFPWNPVMQMPEALRGLRKDPVVEVTLPSGDNALLVTRYNDVRALFADERLSHNIARPDVARIFAGTELFVDPRINRDPPRHTNVRGLVTHAFTARRMEALRRRTQRITDELVNSMVVGPRPAELNEALARPLSIKVICLLLGVPVEDCDQLRRSLDGFLLFTKMRSEEAARWRQDLWEYVGGFIESKRTNPGSDLASDLIRAHDEDDDRINEHELHFWVQGLLIAGYIFTSSQIATGTAVLLHHRYLVDEIQQNLSLIPSAVEELLRTQIAVSSTANLVYATEDIELDGYTIRKGASVVLSMESANVDETVFDDPFTINIRRTENHHMTFGGGPHYCVGAALARMELQVSTETLLRRFPNIHLAVPAERLPRSLGGFMEGFTKVPVEW
jgi:cytochrome P450